MTNRAIITIFTNSKDPEQVDDLSPSDAQTFTVNEGDSLKMKSEVVKNLSRLEIKLERVEILKPIIPEVMPLVKAYRDKPGNGVGGNLHIVLDDGNVHDDHIKFCLEKCIERNDSEGIKLCNLLLSMSKTQRTKISRRFYD